MSQDCARAMTRLHDRARAGGGFALGLLMLGTLAAGGARAADCTPDVLDLRDPDTNARFKVEVVDTPAGRERGLMHREEMARYSGMLFVYEYPQPVAFWMENTLIPLDILFFDQAGVLKTIHENAVPMDRTPLPGGADIVYVLEINAGMAAALDIEPGAEIRHPSMNPELASWSCAKE